MSEQERIVGSLRSALGPFAGNLAEYDYSALISAGCRTPCALALAREQTLRSCELLPLAVDDVLRWQQLQQPYGKPALYIGITEFSLALSIAHNAACLKHTCVHIWQDLAEYLGKLA